MTSIAKRMRRTLLAVPYAVCGGVAALFALPACAVVFPCSSDAIEVPWALAGEEFHYVEPFADGGLLLWPGPGLRRGPGDSNFTITDVRGRIVLRPSRDHSFTLDVDVDRDARRVYTVTSKSVEVLEFGSAAGGFELERTTTSSPPALFEKLDLGFIDNGVICAVGSAGRFAVATNTGLVAMLDSAPLRVLFTLQLQRPAGSHLGEIVYDAATQSLVITSLPNQVDVVDAASGVHRGRVVLDCDEINFAAIATGGTALVGVRRPSEGVALVDLRTLTASVRPRQDGVRNYVLSSAANGDVLVGGCERTGKREFRSMIERWRLTADGMICERRIELMLPGIVMGLAALDENGNRVAVAGVGCVTGLLDLERLGTRPSGDAAGW